MSSKSQSRPLVGDFDSSERGAGTVSLNIVQYFMS